MADLLKPLAGVAVGFPARSTGTAERPTESRNGRRAEASPTPAPSAPNQEQPASQTTLESKGQAQAVLEASAKEVDAFLRASNSELRFLRDEDSGRNYFKVVNPHTGDVIIQVPSEEVLAIARKLKELDATVGKASGVILDERG